MIIPNQLVLFFSFQEPIESVTSDQALDMVQHGKLHILYGGTKVVQHSPPSKTGPGLKGRFSDYVRKCENVKKIAHFSAILWVVLVSTGKSYLLTTQKVIDVKIAHSA